MIELIYNPFYDQQVYSGDSKPENSFLRKKYVGKMGLLSELELRLGLSHPDISPTQRLLSYYNAVTQANKEASLFFHNSFENDPLGVTTTLLKWRDTLVYGGWKQSPLYSSTPLGLSTDASEKIQGLSVIEEIFESQNEFRAVRGVSDFWMEVLSSSQEENDLSDISLHVAMTEHLLHDSDPMLHHILTLLTKNCKLSISYDTAELKNPNQQIHLFTLPDQVEAYQWLFAGEHDSSLAQLDNAVTENRFLLINEDNASLNGVLDSLGMLRVESQFDNVNTTIQQLFRNGLSQFRKPVNLSALKNYLSSSYHPLGDFKKDITNSSNQTYSQSLRSRLLSYLKGQNGFGLSHFGETWDGILSDPEYENNDSILSSPLDVLGFWNTDASRIDAQLECWIKIDALRSYCKVMANWCRMKKTPSADVRVLLEQVKGSFLLLETILATYNQVEINYTDLVKLIDSISDTCSLPGSCELVGSTDVVRQPSAIAQKITCPVVWLDCYDKGAAFYEFGFLVQQDSVQMNQQGMFIPMKNAVCEQEYQSIKRGLSFVDDLYMIYPNHVSGKLSQSHPIYLEYNKLDGKKVTKCNGWTIRPSLLTFQNQQKANSQVEEYHLKTTKISKDQFPDHQSASSLDLLLNNPFDYVMSIIYDLNSENEPVKSTLKGSVAHLFIHNAFEEANVNGELTHSALKAYIQKDFDEKLQKATLAEGAELLSPENRSVYEDFKIVFLHRSLENLIKIMETYNLVMVASEYDIKSKACLKSSNKDCPLTGSIDCVLKDGQGKAIIFDFKWTDSKQRLESRENEVKENRALQLCIYRMAVEQILQNGNLSTLAQNSPVQGIGYYMLNQGVLITDCPMFNNPLLGFIDYYPQDPSAFNTLSSQICNLYEFRIDQILRGVLEEAEGMKNPDIEYYQNIQNNPNGLFHIGGMKVTKPKSGEIKCTLEKKDTYENHKVLKGILK